MTIEQLSKPELEQLIAVLSNRINRLLKTYNAANEAGDIALMKSIFKLIINRLNQISNLSSRISILDMTGETDTITTPCALDIIGCNWSSSNGVCYIHP